MTLDELVALLNQLTIRYVCRHGTAAQWTANNEILMSAEIGIETDTGVYKIGNGVTAWNSLAYFGGTQAQMSKLFDTAFGTTQGLILFRGSSQWTSLATGISGQFLKTQGPGVNPTWDTPAGTGGSANVNGDTHPSGTIWDDEFEFGSALDTAGARFSGANAWSTITATGSTFTNSVAQGALKLINSLPSGSSTHVCAAVQAVPSGNWTIGCKLSSMAQARANSNAGMYVGLGSTGKFLWFGLNQSGTAVVNLVVQRCTSPVLVSSNVLATAIVARTFGAPGGTYGADVDGVYLRISWDGTNLVFSMSWDGINWNQVYTETGAAFLGSAPTQIGLVSDSETAAAVTVANFDWFRRLA